MIAFRAAADSLCCRKRRHGGADPAAALLSLALMRAVERGGGLDRLLATVGWASVPAAVLVLASDAAGAFGLAQRVYLVLASVLTLLAGLRFLRRGLDASEA
jgi:hypothetical protein